jgi:hypothetical protein
MLTEPQTMLALCIAIGFLMILGGLYAKHAAYILLNGSIFEPLRSAIERRKFQDEEETRPRWLFIKLFDLFTCNLCMTAQVSFWAYVLPLQILAHALWGWPFDTLTGKQLGMVATSALELGSAFVLSLAVASIALAWWEMSGFLGGIEEAVKSSLKEHSRLAEEQATHEELRLQEFHEAFLGYMKEEANEQRRSGTAIPFH